jgi:putative ABC transport system permease protein
MDGLRLDLKHAIRSIASAKKLSAVVVATLALGIGANTAVFGVLHAVVLKPLPYDEPDRLVRIYHDTISSHGYMPGPELLGYRDGSRALDVAAVYTYSAEGADLTDRAEPERVRVLSVSADYFRVLRVHPLLGQGFDRADERRDARVALVSERIWRKYLGGGADATGRTLHLDGVAYRVAAVLPGTFDDPLEPGIDVWTPLNLQPGRSNSWNNFYLSAIARLQPGATIEAAQAELNGIAAALRSQNGLTRAWSARVVPLHVDTAGGARTLLWILLGAVAMLLVIACVNVASLMLARGAGRRTELAVRSALGCPAGRLVRQLLLESLLLSIAGGVAGLLLARAATGALMAAAPAAVARAGGGPLARAVFAFSAAIAVLAGLAFGAAPALKGARPDLDAVLRDAGRGGSGGRAHTRTRDALVVSQIALALVLLVGAGLLLRSFERLQSVDIGVSPSQVLTFSVSLPSGRYGDPERRARFYRDFAARLGGIAGVRSAAAISRLPVTGSYHSWFAGRADRPENSGLLAEQRVIEGPYFAAVGIPILRGRTFDARDDAHAPRRMVISQELARQLYPGEDPVGQQLRVNDTQAEIIGVVGDVALGVRLPPQPYVYHSHSQFASDRNWELTQVVKFDGAGPLLVGDARRELSRIDPALVLYEPRMLEDVIGGGVAQERFALRLVGAFALLALVLAAVGIYGVLSYAVSRRRREMGIRMALGAPAAAVRSMVVRDGGRLAIAGIACGSVGAIAATRLLRSLLFGVSATEPAVFAVAAAVLAGVALAASWIPASTATKVDPLEAVRD